MSFKNIENDLLSNDPEIQEKAISALEKIGDPKAIALLFKCLDSASWRTDKTPPSNPELPLEGRNLYEPLSYLAVKAFARIFPNAPVTPEEHPITRDHVSQMKSWLIENKKIPS